MDAIPAQTRPSLATGEVPIKAYRSYNAYLKERFGKRVFKVSIDAGFDCPNRDGSKGVGGCTFCDETGSSSRSNSGRASITEQMLKNIRYRQGRFLAKGFIAYFQSFTNTYDAPDALKARYDEALAAHPDVLGLAISTRPDCVDEAILDLIASYQQQVPYVSVEYGLQSIHNRSLALVNRCETVEDFEQAFRWTQARGLDHCVHVILGLPEESWEDMMATAEALARWRVAGVKIHLLVAMEHTPIAEKYLTGVWESLSFEAYVRTCVDFIERLHPECVIHRVAGNGHPKHVVSPLWMTQQREDVMAAIDAEFAHRGTQQGSLFRG